MPHSAEDFVGAWSLVDWRIEYGDGKVTRPFGEGAQGYIVYSADGTMTASIARGHRERFNLANARAASPEQKSAAFDSYFHYAGPWRIEGTEVVHSVAMSLNPDFPGTEQRRRFNFDGKLGLTLSANEAVGQEGFRHHILQWRRAV